MTDTRDWSLLRRFAHAGARAAGDRRALIAVLAFFMWALDAMGQSGPAFSFDPDDQPQSGGGVDSVSPYNGQLSITVPIGPTYQVGPGLSFQLRLYYSSRVWGPGTWFLWTNQTPNVIEPYMLLQGDPALGLGWTLSMGKIVEAAAGIPAAYIAPDGSAHRFFSARFYGGSSDGFFYTRDSSYLRVKYLGSSSGYQMWTPGGNSTTFAHQVTGLDDAANNYIDDFGRGRNGWHATSIANPYGDAITITYQSGYPWVPYQITIPSISGSTVTNRTLTVNMAGTLISSFSVPTFNGASATYTLNHTNHGQISRPLPHPVTNPSPYFLDSISLPFAGYSSSYTFSYTDFFSSIALARGTLRSQTTPLGATITYDYGTWTFYHSNPLNRPYNCGCPPSVPPGRPILKTGYQAEPSPAPVSDCGAPDRGAGVVQRTIGFNSAVTEYIQYDFPRGESDSDTAAQTETLVISPSDDASKQHTTSYLFQASTSSGISGPLVGSLTRRLVFPGDASAGYSGSGAVCPYAGFCLTKAERSEVLTYATDAGNPTICSGGFETSDSIQVNTRLLKSVIAYNALASDGSVTGKYHQIDYVWDSNAGQYGMMTHSGTVGGDARETETTWAPVIDSTHWKLDVPHFQYLRATHGGANFSTVTNAFDSNGYPTSSTITDPTYGTLVHSTPRDSHGFPSSETFTHGGSTYTRNLTFSAGNLKTSQWSGIGWKSTDDDVDSTTGLVQTSRDPSGLLPTTFTYDLFSRPLVTTPPAADAPTTITYDAPTQVTSVTSVGPTEYSWSRIFTDPLSRTIKTQRKMPGSVIVKKVFRYDKQGNKTFESEWVPDSESDSTTKGTSFTSYDDFGRPGRITTADGKYTDFDYSDGFSNPASVWLKSVTISDVGGSTSLTKYLSDAFGNLIKVTEPTNDDTTYAYNPQDRLVQVVQGAGTQTRTFLYDALGFLRKENFPEKQYQDVAYGTYDALGNVLSETQPGSTSITRTYDTAGRLTGILANGIQYVTNCYDGTGACTGYSNFPGGTYPAGKLTKRIGRNPASNPAADIIDDFTYSDRAGRLSARTTSISTAAIPPVTQSWIYDQAGEIAQHYHPRSSGLFVVSNTFDHGFPTSVRANGLPVVVNATYNPSGMLASYVTGDDTGQNVTSTIGQDATTYMARPSEISTSGASVNFDTGSYTYDGAGNIRVMGSDTFNYDSLSRLTGSTLSGAGGGSQAYQYDRWANLLQISGTNSRTYSVSSQYNRLNSATYDPRGNLQTIGADTYTWDSLDRMIRYQTGGTDSSYLFDGSSERVVKIPVAGQTSSYVWTFRDGGNRLATEFQGTNLSRDNVFLGNLLVASYGQCSVNGPPGWAYYSSDHLGTPRLITDVSGTTLESRRYWPYGEETSSTSTASAQRFRFSGMERDLEGGGTRYYDHTRSYEFQLTGRFLSLDPVSGDTFDPQSWNLYSYGRCNPLRFNDPTGQDGNDAANAIDEKVDQTIDKLSKRFGSGDAIQDAFVVTGELVKGFSDMLRVGTATGEAIGSGGDSFDVGTAAAQDFGRASQLFVTLGSVAAVGLDSLTPVSSGSSDTAPVTARGGAGPVLKGQAGVARAAAQIEAEGGTVISEQVTIDTAAGSTRIDLVVRNAQGDIELVEVKNGPSARVSPNQRANFDALENGGGTGRGPRAERAGLDGPVPAMRVRIISYR